MTKTARTNGFGYYSFYEVEAGQTIVLSVTSKDYEFMPRAVTITEELSNLDFMAEL